MMEGLVTIVISWNLVISKTGRDLTASGFVLYSDHWTLQLKLTCKFHKKKTLSVLITQGIL